jgi:hypothetical protein
VKKYNIGGNIQLDWTGEVPDASQAYTLQGMKKQVYGAKTSSLLTLPPRVLFYICMYASF